MDFKFFNNFGVIISLVDIIHIFATFQHFVDFVIPNDSDGYRKIMELELKKTRNVQMPLFRYLLHLFVFAC